MLKKKLKRFRDEIKDIGKEGKMNEELGILRKRKE